MNEPSTTLTALTRDVAAVNRIADIPHLLQLICQSTGMRFAVVARVTEVAWVACAVRDDIEFGLQPGDQLPVQSTLCAEARAMCAPVAIDDVSTDPVYRDHMTPRLYGFQRYVSVPIVLKSGEYFGNLCAIDPRPGRVSDIRTMSMFLLFAELIALQLDSDRDG